MPNKADKYITTLKKAHLEWGTHRYKPTRDRIYGEGYLQIPRAIAIDLCIYNSNKENSKNEYLCSSKDGFLDNITLKASGSMTQGDNYAKQFQGSGNLKALGDWFANIKAKEGDEVEIEWVSPTEILIDKL